MTTLILTHNDLDGIISALMVEEQMEHYCKIIPVNYPEYNSIIKYLKDIFKQQKIREVVILDYHLFDKDIELLKELSQQYNVLFIYVDHHYTQEERQTDKTYIIVKLASKMSVTYFISSLYKNKSISQDIIDIINKYDTGDFSTKNLYNKTALDCAACIYASTPITTAMLPNCGQCNHVNTLHKWYDIISEGSSLKSKLMYGKKLTYGYLPFYQYKDIMINLLSNKAFAEGQEIMLVYSINYSQIVFSVRATFDISEFPLLNKLHKGHAKAGGFEMTIENGTKLLNAIETHKEADLCWLNLFPYLTHESLPDNLCQLNKEYNYARTKYPI